MVSQSSENGREKDEKKGGEEHQGAEGVDFGCEPCLQPCVDQDRKGIHIGAGDKDTDDHIVKAHGEGEQNAGENTGKNQGKCDIQKHSGRAGAKITGSLLIALVHAGEACLHLHENIGNAEGRMADHQRHHAEGQTKEGEKRQKQHAEDDLGRHHGERGDIFHHALPPEGRTLGADGAERADYGSRQRGQDP